MRLSLAAAVRLMQPPLNIGGRFLGITLPDVLRYHYASKIQSALA